MANNKKQTQAKYSLLDERTPFAVKEAYGMLRTNILYMPTTGNEGRVIAITSAEEGTGKSTTIANLSLAFSRSSKKVVLIDADMRCPRQHKFFKHDKNARGLSEYLAGISSKDEVLIKTEYENLDIISSGHLPPSPSELVLSSRFPKLLDELKKEYDFVFIDFPPIGIVSDAAAVAKCVMGYLFVVRAKHSDMNYVTESLQKLENVDANVLGLIFNDMDYREKSYGKSYINSRYSNSQYARQSQSMQNKNNRPE